jgi:hypothetical protein
MTLKKELESILLKYAGNGHSTDVFYLEVKEAVTRPRVVEKKERSIFYDYDAKVWKLTNEYIAFLTECYDGVDVMGELYKMKGWLSSHPRKINFKAFITNWLAKSQGRSTAFSDSRRGRR